MFRNIVVLLLLACNLAPAFAVNYVTTTRRSPYFNSYNNFNNHYHHCPQCHSNNYYPNNTYRNYRRYYNPYYNPQYRTPLPPVQNRYYRYNNPYFGNSFPALYPINRSSSTKNTNSGIIPVSRYSDNYPLSPLVPYENNYSSSNTISTKKPFIPDNQSFTQEFQPDFSALEKYALNKTYKRESNLERLERLENLAFGAVQNGDFETRYNHVENAILSRPQYNYKKSILGNIADYFAGQPTGFTPSIMDQNLSAFPSYIPTPGYNNRRMEQYSNGLFGNGYSLLDQNFTNGSSIRMLD